MAVKFELTNRLWHIGHKRRREPRSGNGQDASFRIPANEGSERRNHAKGQDHSVEFHWKAGGEAKACSSEMSDVPRWPGPAPATSLCGSAAGIDASDNTARQQKDLRPEKGSVVRRFRSGKLLLSPSMSV